MNNKIKELQLAILMVLLRKDIKNISDLTLSLYNVAKIMKIKSEVKIDRKNNKGFFRINKLNYTLLFNFSYTEKNEKGINFIKFNSVKSLINGKEVI